MTSEPQSTTAIVWLRRDLRLYDQAALYHALRNHQRVMCVFVFDTDILDPLLAAGLDQDRRVEFIHQSVQQVDAILRGYGSALWVLHGSAAKLLPSFAASQNAAAVYTNHDYEPAAIARNEQVKQALQRDGRLLHSFKDQVIFERNEVLSQSGQPFSVFTPYKNAWLRQINPFYLTPYPTEKYFARLMPIGAAKLAPTPLPSLEQLGFAKTNLSELKLPVGPDGAQRLLRDFAARIDSYGDKRDFPAQKGPSYLSVHLRFGTISIRQLAAYAHARAMLRPSNGAAIWLSELIWRDFYHMILSHHPRVVGACFKPEYDAIRWDQDDALLAAWSDGRSGYPLVDAAMRQLKQTGYMHNRLRMVVASFLTKDLGLDWREGERIFAARLLDFDLAANNGGWQWAASTGCDAQPYFRIFNPITQSEKFDPHGHFIRRYVPELARVDTKYLHAPWQLSHDQQVACRTIIGHDYPLPVIHHATARAMTLARFKRVRQG